MHKFAEIYEAFLLDRESWTPPEIAGVMRCWSGSRRRFKSNHRLNVRGVNPDQRSRRDSREHHSSSNPRAVASPSQLQSLSLSCQR